MKSAMQSRFGDLAQRPRPSKPFRQALRLSGLVGRMMLAICVMSGGMAPVWAQEHPPDCTDLGVASFYLSFPNQAVHGQEVCVVVVVMNSGKINSCSVTADAEVTLGDGTVIPVLSGAFVEPLDILICPGADPRCVTASDCTIPGLVGYRFIVRHEDERGESTRTCPPQPDPGIGNEYVSLQTGGMLHSPEGEYWSNCAGGPILIEHQSCTDSCANGEVCAEGICVPPGCEPNGTCEAGETCSSCPEDCLAAQIQCGDGVCEPGAGENCRTCAADCNGRRNGKPADQFCCGAPSGKYPGGCDDPRCNTRGFACGQAVVQACCGDGTCAATEDTCNCPSDCGPHPTEEFAETTCQDGMDNDCDGLADHEDEDCPCENSGSACLMGAQCCSGHCSSRGFCR